MSDDLLRALAVPPVMLGHAPEPRSRLARGQVAVAMAEAAGIDPLDLRDADGAVAAALVERLRERGVL